MSYTSTLGVDRVYHRVHISMQPEKNCGRSGLHKHCDTVQPINHLMLGKYLPHSSLQYGWGQGGTKLKTFLSSIFKIGTWTQKMPIIMFHTGQSTLHFQIIIAILT